MQVIQMLILLNEYQLHKTSANKRINQRLAQELEKLKVSLLVKFFITVVSWVSAHGGLNVTRNFGLNGHLPGCTCNFHTFVFKLKLLYLPLETSYMGAYPGVGACPGHHGDYNYNCAYY